MVRAVKGRKPSAAAKKRGTDRHKQVAKVAPPEHPSLITAQQADQVPLPAQLPDTGPVRELWRLLLRGVAQTELRESDLPLLEAMCVAKFRHFKAGLYVKRRGMMVTTTQGKIRNPMLQEEREQAVLYDRLSQRMGLSPEARVRLNLMAVAGATLLGSLQKAQKEALDEEMPDVVDGEWVEVG